MHLPQHRSAAPPKNKCNIEFFRSHLRRRLHSYAASRLHIDNLFHRSFVPPRRRNSSSHAHAKAPIFKKFWARLKPRSFKALNTIL